MKNSFFIFCVLISSLSFAQDFSLSGKVSNEEGEAVALANIVLFDEDSETAHKGAVSDENGFFTIDKLSPGRYNIEVTYVGYKTLKDSVSVSKNIDNVTFTLVKDQHKLGEAVVSVKSPSIQKTSEKLVFNVENTSLSTGNSLELLKKTPGVLVLNNTIKIQNRPTLIFLNGKRVYLSTAETANFLQNLDASLIRSVEVITNPSAKYDAEASTVLNIITSRAVATGYKGNINGAYEQGTFPKYRMGTSQFFKNDWLNFYGSYTFSPRKEIKEDENFIRFFEPDDISTASFWESDFTRITRSQAHQANIVADFTINEKNSVSISANGMFSPNKEYDNFQYNEFFDAEKTLDSLFLTESDVHMNTHNAFLSAEYTLKIGDKGALLKPSFNYIDYQNSQVQDLFSDYFLPNGNFIRTISFFTNAEQKTTIQTFNLDAETPWLAGSFEAGLKYSNIDSESGLDFFDTDGSTVTFNSALSDLFLYEENIFAGYANYRSTFGKFDIALGIRAEHTDIEGNSRSLGLVNTQEYFKLFPRASLTYRADDKNSFGAAYRRSIERPRYESLNPFRYFLNENLFNAGNPNLTPAFEDKITLSYNYRNKFFVEAYYQYIDNSLGTLTLQDNENLTLRHLDVNMLNFLQYSLDALYFSQVTDWWYLNLVSSFYYLENEFFAIESAEETFTNDTFGAFGQLYSNFTLSKDKTFTSDVSVSYLSNFISGSQTFKNQFIASVSFAKQLWDKRATITVGVDDIFNRQNVRVVTSYLNQDNSYFPRSETRLFKLGFEYNFGNFRLRDNNRNLQMEERERLQKQ